MQLGTRWSVGAEPPARLSDAVKQAISAVESERRAEVGDINDWRWTLTWLEGHPSAELDDGTVLRERHDGAVDVSREND